MWTLLLQGLGFGFFWFIMLFMVQLFSATEGSTTKDLTNNYITFVGVPFLLFLIYKMYAAVRSDLHIPTELLHFTLVVIVPLVIVILYVRYGT